MRAQLTTETAVLFNSFEYLLLFLPLVVCLYWALAGWNPRIAAVALVVASLFFYGYWSLRFIPILLFSVTVNFAAARWLVASRHTGSEARRRAVLFGGLAFNVGLLGYFKYADFFLANIGTALGREFPALHLALPLGISFFTFQKIAFLVDCYKRKVASANLLDYGLFVTFFPQLIAGPIVHHAEVMPQFAAVRHTGPNFENIARGLFLISVGLFKKVLLADSLAEFADLGHHSYGDLTFFSAWVTTLAYTFQLYFDFSGYIDMALGSALMFNIELPANFRSPYRAVSIQEFWRRWHITLGRFLRDYVFIPLGGSRGALPATLLNLFVTFLVGGLWHGASWLFVLWGSLHGAAMVVHRLWTATEYRMPRWAGWALTFTFVSLTWIPFRATSWDGMKAILAALSGVNGIVLPARLEPMLHGLAGPFGFGKWLTPFDNLLSGEAVLTLAISAVIAFGFPNSMDLAARRAHGWGRLAACCALFVASYVFMGRPSSFLYWQF